MKAKQKAQHPSNFVFFDTETKDLYKGTNKQLQRHQLWFGFVWAFRYEQGKVKRSVKIRFTTAEGFYQAIESRLDPHKPLYCFAHNLGFDLTQVDWWNSAEQRGLDCNYAVLENPPIFLSYQWNGARLILLDTFNFWKCGVSEMGKHLGMEKLDMPKLTAPKKDWDVYCFRDVEIIGNQVMNLLDYLTENELGSFAISAPALAMNCFKTRFMKHKIFLHDRYRVSKLERDCYYGGLVNNYYIGQANGKTLHYTDVNSLYPSVMLNDFPVRLEGDAESMDLKTLKLILSKFGVCATVRINSTIHPYICRHGNKTMELTGNFTTSLAGPELIAAVNRNHVTHVYHAAWYTMAPIFTDYVQYFWAERARFKAQGDKPKEQLVKLLMNSLYGKFGMKGFDWVDYTPENLAVMYELHGLIMPMKYWDRDWAPPITNHTSLWFPDDLGREVSLRYIGGKLQIKLPTGEHSESFCAIAAYVTSYARQRLRHLMSIAGHRHVYYCDTDSLFVDDLGLGCLTARHEVSATTLGKLKHESSSKEWAFYGPKDYVFGDKTVIKGIRANAIKVGLATYEQDQFEGLKSVLNRGGKAHIDIKRITKRNKRNYDKGSIGATGWTTPLSIFEQ